MASPSRDFAQTEYLDVPFTPSPAEVLRASMAANVKAPRREFDSEPNFLLRAIAVGLLGAAVGAVIYAVFVGLTGIRIGYLSLLVAYLVGKSMSVGSEQRGGLQYQITAVALTYLSVAVAHAMLLWWFAHLDGPVTFNFNTIKGLVSYGLFFPAFQVASSPGRGLLRIFILFVGLRAAWRMASADPAVSRHPFKR